MAPVALLTLTSELGDSSATLNEMEEIVEEEEDEESRVSAQICLNVVGGRVVL